MSQKVTSSPVLLGLPRKEAKIQFVLTGFKPDLGFRIFTFERNELSGPRTSYSVKVDLTLARKYGIQTQALPLLCLTLLDRMDCRTEIALTYGEDEMSSYARTCKEERAAASLKRQSIRRTHTTAAQRGIGWRTSGPAPVA